MENDERDLEAILAGEDESFESYLEQKVKSCGRVLPVGELADDAEVSSEKASRNGTEDQPDSSASSDARDAGELIGSHVVPVMSEATRAKLQREAAERREAEERERSAKIREALDAATKRRAALEALPEDQRNAEVLKRVDEEIERLKQDPTPSSAVHIVDHIPIEKIKTHEVTGTYVEEVDGLMEWDEELKNLYFGNYHTSYQEDMTYEQNKASLEDVIRQTHKLTRAVKMIKAMIGGKTKAKLALLKRISEFDRISMQELDELERQKYHGRKVAKESKKKTDTPKKSTGKTAAQKNIDTFISLMFDRETIIAHLKTKNLWDSSAEAYLDKKFATQ